MPSNFILVAWDRDTWLLEVKYLILSLLWEGSRLHNCIISHHFRTFEGVINIVKEKLRLESMIKSEDYCKHLRSALLTGYHAEETKMKFQDFFPTKSHFLTFSLTYSSQTKIYLSFVQNPLIFYSRTCIQSMYNKDQYRVK